MSKLKKLHQYQTNEVSTKLRSGKLDLKLYLSPQKLSYALSDESSNTLEFLEAYRTESSEHIWTESIHHLQTSNLFKSSFQHVSIIVDNEGDTLIPESLYDHQSKKMVAFVSGAKNDSQVLFDPIQQIGAVNGYIVPREVDKQLKQLFPNSRTSSSETKFIEASLKAGTSEIKTKVVAWCKNESLVYNLIHEGQVIFSNTFPTNSNEDTAYFLLFVSEQMQINREEIPFFLYGNPATLNELDELLKNYLSHRIFNDASTYKLVNVPQEEIVIENFILLT